MPQSRLEAAFWNKVNFLGAIPKHCPELGSCWVWTGKTNQFGYGIAWRDKREVRAHRLAYEIQVGKFDLTLCVLHKCDNPACVRATHLFIGTKLDNAQDALKKGRLTAQTETLRRLWRERWRKTHCGENHPLSKLTEADVLEMRRLYRPGVFGTTRLARKFGICQQTAHEIVTYQIWKHLPKAAAPATGAAAPS